MSKLILIRHGETQANKNKVFFGWQDIPLNENGINQAKQALKILKKYKYEYIYSSPLSRAIETAKIVNYQNYDIIVNENLKEMNFGIFEGLTYKEACNLYPSESKIALENWENYNFINGESPKELQNRVMKFLKEVMDYKNDIVIVSHWGVISSILSHYISKELDGYWKFNIKNGGIVILEINEEYVSLEGFNIGE